MIIDETFVGILLQQQEISLYGCEFRLAEQAAGRMAGPGQANVKDDQGKLTFEVSGGMSSRMFVCIIFIN